MAGKANLGELLVTLEADTKPYRAEVERARQELERVARATTGTANAGGALGSTFAGSSSGISRMTSALSQLAGRATGTNEALRGLIEGALLFSAGSVAVSAVAAGVTIVASAYAALTKEAREAAEAGEQAASDLVTAWREATLQVQQSQLEQARAQRERLAASIAQLEGPRGASASIFGGTGADEAAKRLAVLRPQLAELDLAIAAGQAELDRLANEAANAGTAAEQASPKVQRLADRTKELATVAAEAERRLAELTGTTLDQGLLAFERELATVLQKVADADTTGPWAELAGVLQTIVERLRAARSELDQVRPANVLVPGAGVGLRGKAGMELLSPVPPNAAENAREAARQVAEITRQVGQAARGALALADAFSDMSDSARRSLESVIQVAEAVPALVAGIRSGASGDIISGALGVLGGIAGLFAGGESPSERANREAIEANTRTLERVREGLLSALGANVTGASYGRALELLANPARTAVSFLDPRRQRDRQLLDEVAAELGIDITGYGTQKLEQLRRRIIEQQIYGGGFSGRAGRFEDAIGILGVGDPIEQLRRYGREVLGVIPGIPGGSPDGMPSNALARALATADLSTPEGRAALDAALKSIFEQFSALRPDQYASFLGDLTPEQFRDAIREIQGLLGRVPDLGQTTESFGINRSITEVTGSRIGAYLATANVYAERTAANTAAMVSLLQQLLASQGVSTLIPLGPDIATIDRQLADRASAARQASGSLLIS